MSQPSFYAVIPANVRYDKTIPANAKLLYGEITALCSQEGYCWASNSYFADLYDVSETSISKWISALAKAGYIFIEANKEKGNARLIYLKEVYNKTSIGIEEKLKTPIEEKLKHNNTRPITTNITTSSIDISSASPLETTIIEESIKYLNAKTGAKYKATTPKTRTLIKARIKEGFTLNDFYTVIDKKVLMWGKNADMQAYLRPETLFGAKFEGYLNEIVTPSLALVASGAISSQDARNLETAKRWADKKMGEHK